jgi:hypothetical protein
LTALLGKILFIELIFKDGPMHKISARTQARVAAKRRWPSALDAVLLTFSAVLLVISLCGMFGYLRP